LTKHRFLLYNTIASYLGRVISTNNVFKPIWNKVSKTALEKLI